MRKESNADLQRKHTLWAKEVVQLQAGDLSIKEYVDNAVIRLLHYVNSRIKLKLFSQADRIATERRLSKTDVVNKSFSFEASGWAERNGETFSYLDDGRSHRVIRYQVLYCGSRNNLLTRERVQSVFNVTNAILLLSTDGTKKIDDEQHRAKIAEIDKILADAIEQQRDLHTLYAAHHHTHIPGSYFFGQGTWFQSKAENTLLSLREQLRDLKEKSETLYLSHQKEEGAFTAFKSRMK